MVADYTIVQGDTAPVFTDTLTYSDETAVNLTGATVTFVMRALTAAAPVSLAGTTTVTAAAIGAVKFSPSAADTASPGMFMAKWSVVFQDGSTMQFPTVGYLWVSVEENLTTAGGAQLVGLPDVKDYLNLPANDRIHDAKLIRFIHAVRPLIENITGPIIPTTFTEWHDGGQYFIQIRRRPSTAPGTSPVLTLNSISEYIGPTEYPLTIVTDPAHGSIYSAMLDPTGRIVRRTAGGGVIGFNPMADAVVVSYTAGQAVTPPNVYEAALEAIRINYQTTQQVGRGRRTEADEPETTGMAPLGFFLPRRVRELLSPNRRAPSVA